MINSWLEKLRRTMAEKKVCTHTSAVDDALFYSSYTEIG